MSKINPELLDTKATHKLKDGTPIKLFKSCAERFDFDGNLSGTAEIMDSSSKGKWTSVSLKELIKVEC